ncbi:alpha/beta hydrolase fold-domain-containing protein [Halteromyces radiatus]|uniref:alpha/beta hydrolase fold-domain-containing protein n=1 Tax=Halteromyces radiatus TaxID=101107 RepID=UPI00221F124F|nr:alpha/beta hydrolase fold-domain-containing protein [Halteromyces radiatus]KAI8086424.1 alpha/beta hydrolase fold-domain-containing protein [Halteromyces radiatus]
MDTIRQQVRRRLPPKATIKILRKVFTLPAPAARLVLDDITKPRKSHRSWYKKVPWNQEWTGCWIGENIQKVDDKGLAERIEKADIIIFNVHGGGFRVGRCTMFLDTYIKWIRVLKEKYGVTVLIMSVDYRLAPEYKFPSPVEDVVRAYECLIKTHKVDGSKIIAIGDSNGSSLILEMLFITHDPSMFEIVTDDPEGEAEGGAPILTELPRPAGTVLISPLVTEETTSQSWKENVKYDYVSQHTAKLIKKDYFHPLEPNAPPDAQHVLGIMRLQTGFQAFFSPRVLLYIGHKEVMRDDALDLGAKAEQDGVDIEIVMEDCVHDWFCVREVVKDKSILDRADKIFADFCYRSVFLRDGGNNYDNKSSVRRSSDGLHAVPEMDEDAEDEFHEAMTEYTDMGSTVSTAVYERHISNSKGTKTKTLTVFV